MQSPRSRSSLRDPVHLKKLLTRITALFAQKASRLEFRVPGDRYSAGACANVTIDTTTGAITYDDPAAVSKSYVLADIEIIKRLRNKKYLIAFKS